MGVEAPGYKYTGRLLIFSIRWNTRCKSSSEIYAASPHFSKNILIVVKARSSDQFIGTAGAALAVAGLGGPGFQRFLYSRTRWAFVTPTSR